MRPRALCDCGNPIEPGLHIGNSPVCKRCFTIDSLRMRLERQKREQAKRGNRTLDEFAETADVFHSLAT